MSSSRLLLGLLLSGAIIAFGCLKFSNQKELINPTLDPITTTPEWMQVLVEAVLPKSGMHGWIPTGDFETSSLIKIPRFLRNYAQKELANNLILERFVAEPSKSPIQLTASVVKNERFQDN